MTGDISLANCNLITASSGVRINRLINQDTGYRFAFKSQVTGRGFDYVISIEHVTLRAARESGLDD